jgi:hypothetical protein
MPYGPHLYSKSYLFIKLYIVRERKRAAKSGRRERVRKSAESCKASSPLSSPSIFGQTYKDGHR